MTKYVVLLRGVNVGGKNKVVMSEFKSQLQKLGFEDVRSYINSGNLIVESDLVSSDAVLEKINEFLLDHYAFPVDAAVMSGKEYQEECSKAPVWWGEDPGDRHNVLYLLSDTDKTEIKKKILAAITEYDQVHFGEKVLFWSSAFEKNYSRSYYSKLVKEPFYKKVTVRNRNTALKLLDFLV